GMFHLVDRFLVLVPGQLLQAPVLQHLGMQEVLVDRGQLVVERLVEELDDLCVALHGASPWLVTATTLIPSARRRRNANRVHYRARRRAGAGRRHGRRRIQAAWGMRGNATTLSPHAG